MKKILATTALVMILASNASAQMQSYTAQPQDIEASDFLGMTIYAAEDMPAADAVIADGGEKDWDNIGEINDVILGRDGQIKAVVLGVGGFLGIGEKNIAVRMQDVKFVRDGDDADDFFLVVNANKEALTSAPAYVAREDAATAPATTAESTADATTQTMADDNRTRLVRPEVTREGYKATEAAELTADKLEGARVYGPKDEDVGEINRLVLNSKGQIDRVVLDVGGFLGMGERQIAVTLDELTIVRADGGDDFRVYVDANKANLEAQPEYKN